MLVKLDRNSSLTVDFFLFYYSLLVLPLGEIKMYIVHEEDQRQDCGKPSNIDGQLRPEGWPPVLTANSDVSECGADPGPRCVKPGAERDNASRFPNRHNAWPGSFRKDSG